MTPEAGIPVSEQDQWDAARSVLERTQLYEGFVQLTAGQCAPLTESGFVSVMAWGFASSAPRDCVRLGRPVETHLGLSVVVPRDRQAPSVRKRQATLRFPRLLRGSIPAAAVTVLLALSACGEKHELPPIQPEASLCTFFTPWLMSPAAAANETVENLRTHAANNAAHYEKCVTNHPKLDPERKGGPR